MRDICKLSG